MRRLSFAVKCSETDSRARLRFVFFPSKVYPYFSAARQAPASAVSHRGRSRFRFSHGRAFKAGFPAGLPESAYPSHRDWQHIQAYSEAHGHCRASHRRPAVPQSPEQTFSEGPDSGPEMLEIAGGDRHNIFPS